jgi:hypothetical protein
MNRTNDQSNQPRGDDNGSVADGSTGLVKECKNLFSTITRKAERIKNKPEEKTY